MAFTKKNDEAVSPVIGVILMVAVMVILAAVIAAIMIADNVQKEKNCCNGCNQEFTANVTIANMDLGGVTAFTPSYVTTTEPFTYELWWWGSGSHMYNYLEDHMCQNVEITYKKSYRGSCEVRTITSVKEICCCHACGCNTNCGCK